MSLAKYKTKRNFKKTPEPEAKLKLPAKGPLEFVVQRHKASRLHYDFRLEEDGVLKSWAVPKGPSMNPHDKRLAMMVEDHPFEYRKFKGVIPEGYGAGIVEIWDKGYYLPLSEKEEPVASIKKGLKEGNIKIVLKGKKLKGVFALVKMKGADENAWLLIKHKDEFAVDRMYDSEKFTPKSSPINKWLLKHNSNTKSKKANAG